MGVLSRFKDIMASNINALLDKAEDPEKMIDQTMRNLTRDLGKVKEETAAVMADEQRAKRQLDEVNAEIAKMQFSVYEVNNTQRVIDNIKMHIVEKFSKLFRGADSVMIFDAPNAKVQKFGNAIHRDKDVVYL